MKEVSALRAVSVLLIAAAAVAISAQRAKAADTLPIRNAQIVDTAHESWLVATLVNTTQTILDHPAVTFTVDGQQVVVAGPTLESGQAWRIRHRLEKKPQALTGAYATYEIR